MDASARPPATPPQATRDAGVADAAVVVVPPGASAPNRAYTAEQIAAGVQSFYNRTTDFAADFVQRNRVAATNNETVSSGRVEFRRPGRMRWEYAQPVGNLVVSDGTTLWTHEPARRQAFQANLAQSQLPTALSFLMGSGNLSTDFTARRIPMTGRWANFYGLELTPRAPNPSFSRLVLIVEPQNYQVAEAGVIDAQNNQNRFAFTNTRVNLNPPVSRFQWTPPAGTTVIRP